MLDSPPSTPEHLRLVHRVCMRTEVPFQVPYVSPSLLDWRFAGDAWIHDWSDGAFSLCLGNYRLARIGGSPLDQASLNQLLDRIRHRRNRRPRRR